MRGNVVVYSALYGNYDVPKVQPDLGVPLVMMSDRPQDAPGWEVRVEPLVNLPIPMMAAKWWKCRPDLAVPEADVAVWIDASMTVKRPDFARAMAEISAGLDAVFVRHPWRVCIYDEAEASFDPKYANQPIQAQVEYYRSRGYPRSGGLVATGSMVRRNTEASMDFGNAWWAENVRWSYQDQLSLPWVLRQQPHLRWGYLPDVEWEYWWDIAPHVGKVSYA